MALPSSHSNPSWLSSSTSSDSAPSLLPQRPAPPVPVQRSTSTASNQLQQQHQQPPPSASLYQQQSYSTPISSNNPSPNSSSYTLQGTGAGSAQTIVKRGWINVKEDGLRAWIWSKRWLVLREQTLSFYKNDVRHLLPARCCTEQKLTRGRVLWTLLLFGFRWVCCRRAPLRLPT